MAESLLSTVILFQSTTQVMRAEKALVKAAIACRLIPVPRELSSQCGVCIRVDPADSQVAIATLESARISYEASHTVTRL